jgi:hypothetical protein
VFSVHYELSLRIIKIQFHPYKVKVISLVLPTVDCCIYSLVFGSHHNSSVKSRLQNVKWQYLYWKVQTEKLLELVFIFLKC